VTTTASAGAQFSAVQLSGLKKGAKVTFSVTANVLPQSTIGTTQVIRSKSKKGKKKRKKK
jgi:hypothetical protein